ncbi:hypothetical protein GEV43_39845 [Actinomadura sp. J1-007]|nr:hypothetical protein [Actinomadura sp. J1-007]MWK39551.1 hypothetical protein [Actinomadura sp. J1-007]
MGWVRPADPPPTDIPHATDLCGPRQKITREQISAHVPEALRLKRRLTIYALDHGTDVQDVVAVALDQWLRAQQA